VLVLLSGALVLVATILLVIGIWDDQLTLIWISIGCSVVAALVLVVAVRRARHAEPASTAARTQPVPTPQPVEPVEPVEPVGAVAPIGDASAGATDDDWPATGSSAWAPEEWEEGQEVEFPIADYDDLTERQVLPLLPQLYADELDVVEERERLTKSRPEILDRIAELRGAPEEPAGAEPVPTTRADDPVTGDALAGGVAAAGAASLLGAAAASRDAGDAPPPGLVPDEATAPPAAPDDAAASPATEGSTTPSAVKKSATKKTAARKTAASKTASKKAAATKATTKKTTSKKAAATKATTKKSTSKKAAARKTVAKEPPVPDQPSEG
jgi:hypothetical protein